MRTMFFFFIILLTGVAGAQSENPIASLDWQRTHLQDLIDKRIHRTVSPLIASDKVMVETTVKLTKESPRKRIRLVQPQGREETRGLFPLSKLGVWIDPAALEASEAQKTPKNIFANITEVESFISIDTTQEAQKEAVQKAVENTLARLGDFEAKVTVETIEFTATKKTPVEIAFQFQNTIGILIAALLLVFLVVWSISRYQKIEKKKMAIMEAQNQQEMTFSGAAGGMGEVNDGPHKDSTVSGVQTHGAVNVEGLHGVSQFEGLLSKDADRAYVLVKQWLSAQSAGAVSALRLIPASVEMEQLRGLFDRLTEEERKTWRKLLSHESGVDFHAQGNEFLLSQIVGSLLEPPVPVKKEVLDLLSGITPKESVQCAERDPYWGAVFANTLSTVQVAKMFSLMPKELADRVVEESVKFKFEDIGDRLKGMKDVLEQLRSAEGTEVNPLLAKTVDLIREVGPEKESTFFAALAKAGEEKLLRSAATQFFPSEAIPQLPTTVLRDCLRQLSLSFRSELLVSLDEKMRAEFMNAMGAEGTKMRELMESEIEQIQDDESRVKTIEKNKKQLWASFVQVCRQSLREDQGLADDVEAVVQAWVANQIAVHSGGANAA